MTSFSSVQSDNFGNSYGQISFNKQCVQEPSNQQIVKDTSNLAGTSQQRVIQNLAFKIAQLEKQLRKQKEKSTQLQKRNQQLTDMLVSASQSSVKRNEHFLKQVQRKICNFKALKDLNTSTFRPSNDHKEKQYKRKMITEANYQNTRKFSSTNRQSCSSRVKFDCNKQNTNTINERLKTENQKFSKSNQNYQNLDSSHLKHKQRATLQDFQKEKSVYRKSSQTINPQSKYSTMSPFTKNIDTKTFNKLQSKMMRI